MPLGYDDRKHNAVTAAIERVTTAGIKRITFKKHRRVLWARYHSQKVSGKDKPSARFIKHVVFYSAKYTHTKKPFISLFFRLQMALKFEDFRNFGQWCGLDFNTWSSCVAWQLI